MSRTRSAALAPFLAATLVAAPALAHAADFYKGKTVTMIVGFSSGGGYDTYARAVARFLPAHIPGHPNVIVRNQPGAGSLVALRALDVTDPQDGTALLTFNPGLITQSIVQPKKVKVDFSKYKWVGIATPDFRVCYGFGPKGVKSWSDMMHRKQFVLGSTGKGSGNYINGATLRVIFHAPVKQVLGFPGSAEQRLAIERGELDGDCGSISSIPPEWLRDHKAHPFVRFTKQRPPEVPKSAPYIGTFAKTQEQKKLLNLLDSGDEIGRSYIMSAAVPPARLAIMRKAFDETMKDPAFLAQAKKELLPIHPISGAEADKIAASIRNASPAIVAKAREIYQ